MIYRRFIFVLILFTCIMLQGEAQQKEYRLSTIIPASPSSTALGSYGNVPVSLYNGTPSISIPIYDITTTNHKVAIGLSYQATGTKVMQDASNTGLGWSLNAGGAVTRIVRQKDDFAAEGNNGYYYARGLPPNNSDNTWKDNPNWQLDGTFFDELYDGRKDGEPDIFNYNFCGYAGRFVLGKKANGSLVYVDQKNNMSIQYTNGGWIFTNDLGYRYYLFTVEVAQDYYRSAPTELTNLNGVDGLHRNLNSSPITAWYLDSIVSPASEKISFSYVKGKSLSLWNRSEFYCKLRNIQLSGCLGFTTPVDMLNDFHSYDASRQEIADVYVKEISFLNGSLEFSYSERQDIPYLSSNEPFIKPSKLERITIRDNKKIIIKSFDLGYNYFDGANTDGRLKLESVTEKGKDGIAKPPYLFSYNNYGPLPNKYSKNIDHWGYFNGKSAINYTLLPSVIISDAAQSFYGGDRSPSQSVTDLSNGVLASIKYPTGGSTSFVYELHDYSNLQGENVYETVNKFAMVRSNPDIRPQDNERELYFTIPPFPGQTKVPVIINCSYQRVNPNVSDLVSLGFSRLWRIKSDGSTESVADCSTANFDGAEVNPSEYTKNLDPGNYHMLVQSTAGWSFAMTASWQEKTPVALSLRKGGGIRIKTVTDYDGLNKTAIVKNYTYTADDGKSAGKLLSAPVYAYYYSVGGVNHTIGSGVVWPCAFSANYYGIISSSLYPSGLSSGAGIIGYSKVTETTGENGKIGRTDYYYNNNEEKTDEVPYIPAVGNPLNGKLSLIMLYDEQGIPVKSIRYEYEVKESESLKGIKLQSNATVTSNQYIYNIKYYDNVSSWVVPKLEEETVNNGAQSIKTVTSFEYSPIHRNRIKTDVVKSNGKKVVTITSYPQDYSAGTGFIDAMISSHNISSPVETARYQINTDGSVQVLTGVINYYKPDGKGLIDKIDGLETAVPLALNYFKFSNAPQGILPTSNNRSVFSPDSRYTPRILMNKYDQHGNIAEQQKANDVKETYLWGYNSQYPVAKITNTTFDFAKNYITQGVLDNPFDDATLRTHLKNLRNIPDAFVTTYTYAPLIGLTSETDPAGKTTFYEYDNFNRLKNIKDYQGNIIKNFQYNYLNSCGTNCVVLPMQTLNGSNTIGYPVGVFNVNNQLLGHATTQAQFINLWNANAANQTKGVLSAGADALRFNLTLAVNQTAPTAVTGLRYYQFDLEYTVVDGIRNSNGVYVDFGDQTGMFLGKTILDVNVTLAPNTVIGYAQPYNPTRAPYFIHTYPNNNFKTLTFYHNDGTENAFFDNLNVPGTSLTLMKNFRGALPQFVDRFGNSGSQQASMNSVAKISNWSTISSLIEFVPHNGDGYNPCKNMNYTQDFMANNKGLKLIRTSLYGFYRVGYRDLSFKLSRLKSNWNSYFTDLELVWINEDHWDHEDLSSLKKLNSFSLTATTQDHTDNPLNNPIIPITAQVIDNVINQIASGAGNAGVKKGLISFYGTGSNQPGAASATSLATLKAAGWIIYINNVVQ